MVMRTMRENTKWIMLILTVAFVGWLVFDWVQGRGGAAGAEQNPVVGIVGGQEIRYSEWNRFLTQQLEQARQGRSAPLTDQARHRLEEQAWDQLVSDILIRQEMERLGIQVTDSEIRQAFQMSPPPQLRSHPAFQTEGQFDYQKYREYFQGPGVSQQLLLQIESYYRDVLPRSKLFQLVGQEVYVSDDELWRIYRRRNETASVRFVSLEPGSLVPADSVTVADQEIRTYYREHQDRFSRPASATVQIVSLASGPSPSDSAEARARADSIRGLIVSGEREYAEVARELSEDSATADDGGLVGQITPDQLAQALRDTVFSLPVGRVSEPVATPSGLQLIRVDERRGDTATVRHIVLPLRPSTATEDSLFDTLNELEDVALREGLAAAADSVGLPLRDSVVLTEGSDFVPGAGQLGVAVSWALNPATQVGDLSPQFFENSSGFHLVELVDRQPAGTFELSRVEDQIRQALRREAMKERALERLRDFARAARESGNLASAAEERGWDVRTGGPFTRTDFVSGLGRNTEAVGAAFGLETGRISDPLDAGERVAVIQVTGRTPADRQQFEANLPQLRAQITSQRQQQWLDQWMTELREQAGVQDLRHRLDQQSDQAQGPMGP